MTVDKRFPKNNPVATDAKHTWRLFILQDAGLLHATLASWALYSMLVNESHNLYVCKLEHKNEAIQIVTRKLAMCRGNVSDEVIGTVLILANLEASSQPRRWNYIKTCVLTVSEPDWSI